LSPDGRLAAVTGVGIAGSRYEFVLLTVDVATGRVLNRRAMFSTDSKWRQLADFQGLAFTDASTLRVAWYALPVGADRMYELAEVLHVETLRL
jgi:hypothetical protein